MIDLNKMVNEALVNMEKENFVEIVVKNRLEKTITDIVDDVFKGWSDFGKGLKKHIEENMNVDFENLKLEGYNTLVLAAIKEQIDKTITVQGIDKIKASTDEMLSNIKSEYTLTEIIDQVKKESDKEIYEVDGDQVYMIIDGEEDGYKHIYLSLEEQSHKYNYEYQIDINKAGKAYSVKLNDTELNTKKILGGLYGIDKLLFKIYSSGAKIILDNGMDPEDYDLYLEGEDY